MFRPSKGTTVVNTHSGRRVHDMFCFLTGIDCYMPANGETATMTTNPSVPVDISLNLLKREMALRGKSCLHFSLSAPHAAKKLSDTGPLLLYFLPQWFKVDSRTVQVYPHGFSSSSDESVCSFALHKRQHTSVAAKCRALYDFMR